MNSQDPLFHEDFRDALRHAIKAMGGFEAVGADLWPSKLRKAAGTWLSDCLNAERPAKLDLEEIAEILRMARAASIHCAMHQLADDTGYERPEIAAQPSEAQKIASRMQAVAAEYANLANEMAAISQVKVAQLRSAR